MFPDPSLLWLVAQARQQQDLKAAEQRRMVQWFRQQNPPERNLWQRLAWRSGDWLISAGQRLKAECRAELPDCYRPSKPLV